MRLFILLFLIFMTGCSTNKTYLMDYDNTNPVKIEEATKGLEVSDVVPSKLDGTIAVRSIELDIAHQLDVGVVYMIEDNLITNLLKNGHRVMERDPDALLNIYRESSENYTIDNQNNMLGQDINDQDNSKAVNVINVNLTDDNNSKDNRNSSNSADKEDDLLNITDLNSADYLLSYRVLECGVIYTALNNEDNSPQNINKIQRNAKTRLHCRLTNTKTSEIISAGIVEHQVSDILDKTDVIDLEQISYQYYHHTLPNQGLSGSGLTEDSGYAYIDEMRPIQAASPIPQKSNPSRIMIFFAALLGIILLSQ